MATSRHFVPEGYFVYLARCANGTFYVGHARDVSIRLAEHNAGRGGQYTKVHRPLTLEASWYFPSRGEAMRAEREVKRLSHEQKRTLAESGTSLQQAVQLGTAKSRLRYVICQVCGWYRPCMMKGRDICVTCYRKEPKARCHHCHHMSHNLEKETGLCPICSRIAARPLAMCARCSQVKVIFNQELGVCEACHIYLRHKKRAEVKPREVSCSVCGRVCSSVLFGRAICERCWRAEQNGKQVCAGCKKLKIIYRKADNLCMHCDQKRRAPKVLRSYVTHFTSPYSYNMTLFFALASTINWETVDVEMDRQFRAFGRFLQMHEFREPLTWEAIEAALPPPRWQQQDTQARARHRLVELGNLLAAQGKLEKREDYLEKRNARMRIQTAPSFIQPLLSRYTIWLQERHMTNETICGHMNALSLFWSWCEQRGVRVPAEVQPTLINDYLLTLYWRWQCTHCQGMMPFDPHHRQTPQVCNHCYALHSLVQVKRLTQNTVHTHRAALRVFFDWAKINHLVFANPVQRKIPAGTSTIRHYTPEVIEQLSSSLVDPEADPVEALVLYLIIFHACSVRELRHAEIPTVFSLQSRGQTTILSEAYCVYLPRPPVSLGVRSPGRLDTCIGFPIVSASWLKPLLERFERVRQQSLKNESNRYLLFSPYSSRHNTPVSKSFIQHIVRRNVRKISADSYAV
jgi:predicted GIY-YIG superfamily endonuclease